MLQSNLERDGVNLAIETDLAYFDVGNNRVGILTSSPVSTLHVNGNITANNIALSGQVSATANITGGNIVTAGQVNAAGNITSQSEISASGNTTAANFITSGLITATGNVTSGNMISLGLISAVTSITGDSVTATGNIVGGNLLTGNILIPSSGNVDLANTYVNNLVDPVQNQDAATKKYVDDNIGNIGQIANFTFVDTTISTTTANANIYIDPNGTGTFYIVGTNGFVVPGGTQAERPSSPVQGTLRFNTFSNKLEVWDGAEWDSLAADAIITNQTIVPDGSSATYTLDQESTDDGILVSMNGVLQTPGVDYTVSGSPSDQITFTTVPLTSDIIQVRFVAPISTVSGITNSSGASSIRVTDPNEIVFEIASANVSTITANAVFSMANCQSLQLPSYTVSAANALTDTAAGQIIYVTDGDGGNPCLAVYSGGAWKRVALGATIST